MGNIISLANYVITRNSLRQVFAAVNSNPSNKIILNFAEVEFISRSSADEYLKLKRMTQKNITEININTDVQKMIRVVQDSYFNLKEKKIDNAPTPVFLL